MKRFMGQEVRINRKMNDQSAITGPRSKIANVLFLKENTAKIEKIILSMQITRTKHIIS